MNGLVYHIVSGQAFFSGGLLMMLAMCCSYFRGTTQPRGVWLAVLMGLVLMLSSSTPLPYGWYLFLSLLLICWGATCADVARQRRCSLVLLLVLLITLGAEIPAVWLPRLAPAESRRLCVLGDSLTAGIEHEKDLRTWPHLLAEALAIEVQDISQAGATVASARQRIRAIRVEAPVVLLELGGNDLLGNTSPRDFHLELDLLLGELQSPGRQILMLELPLPPFLHEYGRIQRELAHKHGVLLIPKRVLLSILAADSATIDSLHLTQTGHQRFAQTLGALLAGAYE